MSEENKVQCLGIRSLPRRGMIVGMAVSTATWIRAVQQQSSFLVLVSPLVMDDDVNVDKRYWPFYIRIIIECHANQFCLGFATDLLGPDLWAI